MNINNTRAKHSKSKTYVGAMLIVLIILLLCVVLGGIIMTVYISRNYEKDIDISLFDAAVKSGATKIYYYDMVDRSTVTGEPIELKDERLQGNSCLYVDYYSVPSHLVDAFVAIEDKRFWEHSGVDWKRTAFAAINYLRQGDFEFGGSTITQQLIKNITGERQYSKERKIQEIIWAQNVETKLSKTEIIELYMNVINLSHGCTGVQSAANMYFAKDVSALTLPECASIVAIANNPSYYDPINHPENNIQRRNLVLYQMLEQGYIDENEYDEACAAELKIDLSWNVENEVNSWYTDMVIEDVIDGLCEKYGYTPAAASVLVYSGGLQIYSAMNYEIQNVLEQYYSDRSNFPSDKENNIFQSSMIIIDPETGDILGVAGAVGKKDANRIQNYATQTVRPSGSVIKPLSVYAPALEMGIITSASVYDDVPLEFNLKNGRYTLWPQNSPKVYKGLTNITTAIRDSVNTVAVSVLKKVGIDESFELLYDRLNMKSLISERSLENVGVITDRGVAALALGQQNFGVTVREITGAYTALANRGIYTEPRSYYKVTDALGNVLLSNEKTSYSVFSAETSDIMTKMLENVVSSGTAKAITLDKKIAVAGKTGTTQDNCDKWFIGYTPHFIGGVWCGYEYPESLEDISGNPCIEIWDEIMTIIHRDKNYSQTKKFDMSSDVIKVRCCADSGKRLTAACRADARGSREIVCYFKKGTEPSGYCNCHVMVEYDITSGGVANSYCPPECVVQVGMIQVERKFPIQIYIADAQYVWKTLGIDDDISTDSTLPFFYKSLGWGNFCGISNTKKQFNCGCGIHTEQPQISTDDYTILE